MRYASLSLLVIGFVCVAISSAFFFHSVVCQNSILNIYPQLSGWHNVGNWTLTIITTGIRIEVSPMGYPIPGDSWTIYVYSLGVISGIVYNVPVANCTVIAYIIDQGTSRNIGTVTDDAGIAKFQYSPGYTDVAFQAFQGNYSSNKVVPISENHVSLIAVESQFTASIVLIGFASGVITAYFKIKKKERPRKWLIVLPGTAIALLSVVFVSTVISMHSLGTTWGYPESLFDGVTLNLLLYLMIFALILIGVSGFCVLWSLKKY